MATAAETAALTKPQAPAAAPAQVKWNVEQLKSSYVNFANANSTREEVVMNFGINNSWDRTQSEVEVELAHRLVMSPFAAKRLSELLVKLMAEYESRYGVLK
jgi:spore germination protein YaaH